MTTNAFDEPTTRPIPTSTRVPPNDTADEPATEPNDVPGEAPIGTRTRVP